MDDGAASTDAVPRRLDFCEAQRYHLVNQIQPHGVLFAVDPVTFAIRHVSANATALVGRKAHTLLGSRFDDLAATETMPQLTSLLRDLPCGDPSAVRKSLILNFRDPRGPAADAFVYRSGPHVCIEIELPQPDQADGIETPSSRFFDIVDRITHSPADCPAVSGVACEAIREVTGLDRIYYCEFDRYGHGHVRGESRNGALPDLIDHHFPATDIPEAVRKLLALNPFRLIPDVDAAPVPILGADAASMDLTMSACRAVAASHLRYIRNMGVKASFSLPLVRDGQLKAMFGGHHSIRRRLSFRQMAICRHIVELFRGRSDALQAREESAILAKRLHTIYDLCSQFQAADRDLGAFVAARHDEFCGLMDADDLICRFAGADQRGRSTVREDAAALLNYLAPKLADGAAFFQTDSLGQEDRRFASLCPAVAGVFAVSLDLGGGTIIAWLRREAVVVEKWSGDPYRPAVVDRGGAVSPRTSFLAYLREVKGTSRAWPTTAVDVGAQLQHGLALVLAGHYEAGMRRAAEQSAVLKSEFLANISHELRSPMHAILGFADVLAASGEELPEDRRKRYVGIISDSGHRLLRLIDNLLDLSQLESGKMRFTFATRDMLQVVENAIAEVGELARRKSVEIVVRDRCGAGGAWIDSDRIKQVLINLLSNAVRFSPSGERVTIDVESAEAAERGPKLLIQVSDRGIGIPECELEAVFDKFVQSSRTKSGGGGTGLGLAICREIVEAHNGRIWAANNPDRGASFIVELQPASCMPRTAAE